MTIAMRPGEPLLGNPDADGKVLSSTTAGVRSWVDAITPSYPIYGVEWAKVETPTMTRIGYILTDPEMQGHLERHGLTADEQAVVRSVLGVE